MKEKLSFFHATILIYMFQSGIAILRLPRVAAQYFGTNGWIAIIVVSLIVTCNIMLIGLVYRLGKGRSVFEIVEQSIPKFLVFPVYIALAVVWALLGCLVSKEYVLIFQMFSFPTSPPMALKLLMDVLAIMLVSKGLYVIAKASTIFFWLIIWMMLLFFFFAGDMEWARYTPFIFKDGGNMIQGVFSLYGAFLGYELSLFLFPYADKRTKLMRAVYIGNVIATIVYLITCIVSFGFYSLEQLKLILYPAIDLMSYIKFPFVQRVENLLYGFFMFTTLISTVMYVWAAKEALFRIFKKAKPGVIEFCILVVAYFIAFIPDVIGEVREWLRALGYIEIGVAFGLPIILILILLLQRMKGGMAGG